jgi:hypothetical protein
MSEENDQPTLMTSVTPEAEDKTEDMNHVNIDTVEGEDLDNVEYERPDYFPQNFWTEDDGPDIEGLAKAYSELRTKMSRGDHKAPESYDTSGLENVAEDDPLLSKYTEWAKDNGISQEAFDDLAKAFIENGYSPDASAEVDLEAERQALGPNADEIIKSNINWGRSLISKGVFTEDDYTEIEVLGGTAAGQRVIQKIRAMTGEKEIPVTSIEGSAPDREELMSMVADPRYQNDPVYRRQVENAFNNVYGS